MAFITDTSVLQLNQHISEVFFLFSPMDTLYICLGVHSASFGENKKDFNNIKMHSTTTKKNKRTHVAMSKFIL